MSPVKLKGDRTGIAVVVEPGTAPEQAAAVLAQKLKMHQRLYRGARFFLDPGAASQPEMALAIAAVFERFPELNLADRPVSYESPPEALFIRETLRSGDCIRHHGDVVVWGNVNSGAEIIASGDVYVHGAIYGKVHAGALGNPDAVIRAAVFQPTQLRIANLIGLVDRPRRGLRRRVATDRQMIACVQDGTIQIREERAV